MYLCEVDRSSSRCLAQVVVRSFVCHVGWRVRRSLETHISSNSKSAIIQALLVWLARMLTKLLLLRINKYRIFNRKLQYGEWSWEIGERCEWKISSQKEKKKRFTSQSREAHQLWPSKKTKYYINLNGDKLVLMTICFNFIDELSLSGLVKHAFFVVEI